MQSSTLALLLASQFLGPTHLVPPACSVVVMAIMGLSLGSFWGKGNRIREVLGLRRRSAAGLPWVLFEKWFSISMSSVENFFICWGWGWGGCRTERSSEALFWVRKSWGGIWCRGAKRMFWLALDEGASESQVRKSWEFVWGDGESSFGNGKEKVAIFLWRLEQGDNTRCSLCSHHLVPDWGRNAHHSGCIDIVVYENLG